MVEKYIKWELEVCPICHSDYWVWAKNINGDCILCMRGCEKESLKPKMITVTELKEKEVLK